MITKDPQCLTLENLARELSDMGERARSTLRISPGDSDKHFDIEVIGVIGVRYQLIVSAPVTAGGGLIAVHKGQTLTCHWVNPANIFRFTATIIKIVFEPIPLLHLELTDDITRREVRSLPRALVNLHAIIKTPEVVAALIVDLSVGGGRIAVGDEIQLATAQEVELVAKPSLLGREFLLTLSCTVTGPIAAGKPGKHPVRYYGLKFEKPSETDFLVLHGYVQQFLALELDTLTQVLDDKIKFKGDR